MEISPDSSPISNDETAILDRVMGSAEDRLTRQAAESLLGLGFAEQDLQRMNELAEKNRRGEADPNDMAEIERYSRIGNLLNLLQSKARQTLSNG